jgi:apolipoprotein N-acyltransferase
MKASRPSAFAQPISTGADAALRRLANRLRHLAGWRRLATAGCLGLLAATGLPPLYLILLLIPAFTGLLWLLDGSRSTRSAFAVGWWFGVGYFVAGLYWIAEAFLVNAERFAWMIPFALFGLTGALAVFTGFATLAVHKSGVGGVARVLAFGVAWVGAEWLRGHLLTGFPWNLIGYVWTVSDAMLQVTAVTGIYGLSLITVIAAAMPAALADTAERSSARAKGWAFASMAAVLAAVWAGGQLRLNAAETQSVPGVRLRIVQPNIAQSEKWNRNERAEHLARLLHLSTMPAKEPVTQVIWPEAAVALALNRDEVDRNLFGSVAPQNGLVVTGVLRIASETDGEPRAWNSVLAIDPGGSVMATYDKFHLVPFGEYMPLRDLLPLDPIAAGPIDLSAGSGPKTLTLPGLPPVSPLVCYEAIFPGEVVDPLRRPQWLLNVTNDAWFGSSAGPYQHFAIARVRAVEEGLPLVRAANTGISAVVDPYGRIRDQLGLGRQGVLDGPLPAGLDAPTPYARYGDWILLGALAFLVALTGLIKQVGERRSQASARHRA